MSKVSPSRVLNEILHNKEKRNNSTFIYGGENAISKKADNNMILITSLFI